ARTVHDRDGGQCTFRDESGRRCSERTGLHFDHVVPHALGGESTVDNLRLRCGPHNQLHAEQCFGPLFVERRRARDSANPRNSRLG
ncbi:MAG: HNH endonuclease, partial [Deltaproteobacteria bacterium]|nr:HNH endonuclease [Deltaproteobacteria bacterium]